MHQYICKGKRDDGKGWVYGFASMTSFGCGFDLSIITFNGGSTIPYKVIPETVGRNTGIIDMTGDNIFEFDEISTWHNNVKFTGVIRYENGGFLVSSLDIPDGYIWLHELVTEYNALHGYVIGNIFDNKEQP